MSSGKILFIDAYDSFSNNIITLLKDQLAVTVESIHIDDPRFVFNDDAFFAYLQHFDAVVAGPGPGHPATAEDVGLIAKLWTLDDKHRLPVLGICLGFQSLCLAHGATVSRLQQPRHGLVTQITHSQNDVYRDTGKVLATQYHSLSVRLSELDLAEDGSDPWTATRACPDLLPLAWDLSDPGNGPILMAARHRCNPFRGVQYHPESICTNEEGHNLVMHWWQDACEWNAERRYRQTADTGRQDLLSRGTHVASASPPAHEVAKVQWTSFSPKASLDVEDIMQACKVHTPGHAPILLESGTRDGQPVNPETGRFSSIGLQDDQSIHIYYSISTRTLNISQGGEGLLSETVEVADVFSTLEQFVADREVVDGPTDSPFWGGLVGFISYEAGLETIDVPSSLGQQARPDVWFVFVEQSIVLDHVNNVIYLQTLRADDKAWHDDLQSRLKHICSHTASPGKHGLRNGEAATLVAGPSMENYRHKVVQCQEHLRAGSSYELCLTDQTRIRSAEESWSVYRRLRSQNPAPFSAYLEFSSPTRDTPGITLLSSSPERFLSWSRSGECQYRPIEGTVTKAAGVTSRDAEEILGSVKERAENLMIVDLIRHDLSGVRGVSAVHVPKLMTVEEYATVYQLVSVISGQLSPTTSGVSVLAASLPPGSMTGAPKKRSCSLLDGTESGKPRGLYSGVLGYPDVGGGGDFSVVIRTAFKYGGEDEWRVGAGGAVTVLSEPRAEWEEMLAKRESLLRVFGV